PPPAPPPAKADVVVDRLHDEKNCRPPRPPERDDRPHEMERVPDDVPEPAEPPRPGRPAPSQERPQERERVGPGRVPYDLDVGLVVDVRPGRDRDAARIVDVAPPRSHAEERLAVRANEIAESIRDSPERPGL